MWYREGVIFTGVLGIYNRGVLYCSVHNYVLLARYECNENGQIVLAWCSPVRLASILLETFAKIWTGIMSGKRENRRGHNGILLVALDKQKGWWHPCCYSALPRVIGSECVAGHRSLGRSWCLRLVIGVFVDLDRDCDSALSAQLYAVVQAGHVWLVLRQTP